VTSSIKVGLADDADRFLASDQTVWAAEVSAAPTELQLTGVPTDQRFAAEVDDCDPATYAGVYGVYPMTLAVPGGASLPCAGLTWVGVHPDHRRRGVLTAMIRHHLEQVRAADGVDVSALHASEPQIYGRYGYGLASLEHEVTLSRGTTFTAPHLEDDAASITTRMSTVSEDGVPGRMHECHLATADTGEVVGAAEYYERVCLQLPEQLRGKEPWRVLFARQAGEDVGWAMFRRSERWEGSRPSGELRVWAIDGTPAAQLALLRRLVDFDLMGTVHLRPIGVDHPLLSWTRGPRGTAELATYDSLWVRLVDLPEALQARAWSAPCDVVVDVDDAHADWNHGTWRIRSDGSSATVERSTSTPEVRLPVEALGAAYLGGGNLVAMLRAGLVSESRPHAVAELWRAMRTDAAPGAAVMF
jgi:GNAT superfamily N-acetyltransferase